MKDPKDKIKRIGLFLLIAVLAVVEFGLDVRRAGGGSKGAFTVMIVLACLGLVRDIRKGAKGMRQEEPEEQEHTVLPSEAVADLMMKGTASALGGLDWALRKINPDYDPDAERNARRADPDAARKLDEMKQAGLIDEKEYQQRKKKLEKNKASPGGSCRA